jgi:hypothetical protein
VPGLDRIEHRCGVELLDRLTDHEPNIHSTTDSFAEANDARLGGAIELG